MTQISHLSYIESLQIFEIVFVNDFRVKNVMYIKIDIIGIPQILYYSKILGNYPDPSVLTTTISTTTTRFSTTIQAVTQRTTLTSTFGPTSSISPRNLDFVPSTDANFEFVDVPDVQPSSSSIVRRFKRQDELLQPTTNEISNTNGLPKTTYFKEN